MLFNSFQFLIFFPCVVAIFFLLPQRFRWLHLLVSSCVFYCAFIPVYLLVLFFTIIIDYTAGICIETSSGRKRKLFLILSLVANLGVLVIFKYYNFFTENIDHLLAAIYITVHPLPYLHLILPIGLSFHTFQAMSYTIEVYRGRQKAERHFGMYSLYVMFFPQLVAGPIERPNQLIHQFYEEKKFEFPRVVSGLEQMAWGLFKKVVVADQIAVYVNSVYDHWEFHHGLLLLLSTWAFAFQIYCDFSGYSDIAQGAARVMGFRLMDNFSLPYFAKTITEFWRRWHISLSTWLRDYLYIPLGGNRLGKFATFRNLMITMLLGGLWHGASWNFIIWGGLHGLYLSIERIFGITIQAVSGFVRVVRWFITFNLVCFAWIFFRAQTLEQAMGIIKKIVSIFLFRNSVIPDTGIAASIFLSLSLMLIFEWGFLRKHSFGEWAPSAHWSTWLKPLAFVISIILFIIVFGVSEGSQFIYFQF